MSNRKTGYREEWGKYFNWLRKLKENISKAYCITCKRSFKRDNSGLAQVILVLMVIKTK